MFCYHAGYRIVYVSVSTAENPDRPDRCQHDFPVKPKSSDVLASLLISLAGPYAEFRATRGKSMSVLKRTQETSRRAVRKYPAIV